MCFARRNVRVPPDRRCREAIIEWDVTNWSMALDYWQRNTSQRLSSVKALEIGSHNGGLSLWMALQGARVLCTDLSGPTEEAVKKHTQFNVADRVTYRAVDALQIPFETEFDVVMFKSILGGIGRHDQKNNQAQAIQQMHKALKPGGELFFAENLVASPLHRFLRRRCVAWGTAWRYVTIEEMHEFLSIFAQVQYITVGFLGALGRGNRQRNLLGGLDRAFVDRLVPESWRYVMIGLARK